jgi:hypothetical protein
MQPTSFRRILLFLAIFGVVSLTANAQKKASSIWTEVSESAAQTGFAQRSVAADSYRVFRLDKYAIESLLVRAPEERSALARATQSILELPMPDGTYARFRIEHSPIVEPGLAEKYPELAQTYRGQGIDDPSATVRFDLLSSGFHSMILSPRGVVFVDPYAQGDTENYVSYYKENLKRSAQFSCEFERANEFSTSLSNKKGSFRTFVPEVAALSPAVSSGATLRTYRLALAATGEYTAVSGGTVASALAAQVLIMNRVNGVYERELATRMIIVANNDQVIYTSGASDPYTNTNGTTMLGQNQTNLDTVIGTANYDIGHVFSTGGGGVATVANVCRTSKARGVTGLPDPTGDGFSIDFVAHEMGHQFGADHTFNGVGGFCDSGSRNAATAFEPGSAITIMGYAGTCDAQDLAAHSIDTFHFSSLDEIIAYSQLGQGNSCAVAAATNNTPPAISVVGGSAFNVPKQTPFTLTASATDANGDTLTYDWQEFDLGALTAAMPNVDTDSARPIFRVYSPVSSPSRTFPSMQFILNNGNVPPATTDGFLTGESLPSRTRNMTFQVIARDNRAGGGGINTATATVAVDGASGPFTVTSPNSPETVFAGQNKTITWDVNNTNISPVNAANVKISLSTDGGLTFPTVITASTPNNGSFNWAVPAMNTTQARIKIEAVGNIFFDISNTNFTMSPNAQTSGFIVGRLTTAAGVGIPRIYVVLSGPGGSQVAITNGFGYYRFDGISFGQNYTLTPQPRKGYSFSPTSSSITLNSDLTSANFTGQFN